jgi:hypothetical protein
MKFRHPLIIVVLAVTASSPTIAAPAPASSSSPAVLAPAAPHSSTPNARSLRPQRPLLYSQANVVECRRGCAATFAACNATRVAIENQQAHDETCRFNYMSCIQGCGD